MTVQELIERLQDLPPDCRILIDTSQTGGYDTFDISDVEDNTFGSGNVYLVAE